MQVRYSTRTRGRVLLVSSRSLAGRLLGVTETRLSPSPIQDRRRDQGQHATPAHRETHLSLPRSVPGVMRFGRDKQPVTGRVQSGDGAEDMPREREQRRVMLTSSIRYNKPHPSRKGTSGVA